ncbi:hypothetical protein BDV95DRAFT_591830 [Massariosphaeria phaeospora]|uniref:Uncharacterized protein n=1 Tax=Massariosphaeria phaeospora TaxID=100035 RepID=A0A7C8MF60_9PLEO|nr:hypothetical protein BDV95DRAFT_591830 [Massariosphaeria phaeospora]
MATKDPRIYAQACSSAADAVRYGQAAATGLQLLARAKAEAETMATQEEGRRRTAQESLEEQQRTAGLWLSTSPPTTGTGGFSYASLSSIIRRSQTGLKSRRSNALAGHALETAVGHQSSQASQFARGRHSFTTCTVAIVPHGLTNGLGRRPHADKGHSTLQLPAPQIERVLGLYAFASLLLVRSHARAAACGRAKLQNYADAPGQGP